MAGSGKPLQTVLDNPGSLIVPEELGCPHPGCEERNMDWLEILASSREGVTRVRCESCGGIYNLEESFLDRLYRNFSS